MATERGRNWCTLVYPESAPKDWLNILKDLHIPAIISPLHDLDKLEDGSRKKAHYHVLVMFEGNKSFKQMKEIFEKFGGVGAENVHSVSAMARYFCHMDNIEKVRYNENDVICLGGANYNTACEARTDRIQGIKELKKIIRDFNIISFQILCDYCEMYRPDLDYLLSTTCTTYIKEYLRSRKWSRENNCDYLINPSTGEVIIERPDYQFGSNRNEVYSDGC